MSDQVSPGEPRRSRIGNPQDFYGGLVMVALAIFALWASRDLPGMRGFAFGPGTAVRMFAILLGAVGLVVAAVGLVTSGPKIERVAIRSTILGALIIAVYVIVSQTTGHLVALFGFRQGDTVIAAVVALLVTMVLARGADRGPLYVTASVLVFAGTIRPLGLIIASFISLMIASAATLEVRWREAVICAAVLTLFCTLLFSYALNLPFMLWPRF